MFGKSTVQQQKTLNLALQEITEDIEAVCFDENHRSRLYTCLDQNPPYDPQLSKVEEFLKSTNNLEEVREKLDSLIIEVEELIGQVTSIFEEVRKIVGSDKNKYIL